MLKVYCLHTVCHSFWYL